MSRFLHYERCPRCTENGRDRRGDNLAVYNDGGAYCFSCGHHRNSTQFVPRPKEKIVGTTSVLPSDFERHVPTAGWQWLLQYGLGWKYWSPYVGWSEKHSRLIITCGKPVAFGMGRLIGRPETNKERKWYAYGNVHTRPEIIGDYTTNGSKLVCLVEDVVSAHKVGQCSTTIPLFGTQISPPLIPCLRHIGLPVVMWLDKDQDGAAARRATSLSLLTGLRVSYISTENDPKEKSLDFIREKLYNV